MTAPRLVHVDPATGIPISYEENQVSDLTDPLYGAVGNGIADDTAAVRAFIRSLVTPSGGLRMGFVPAGVYRITETGVFNDIAATSRSGMKITGEGAASSIFRLDTSGVDLWFYNNGATPRLNNVIFEDVGFEGMAPSAYSGYASLDDNAKGFRLYSAVATGSHEQSFTFHRCRFDYLHTVMSCEGDNTASETKWIGCRVLRAKSVVLAISNIQSVNHEFISTDIEQIFGDVFSVSTPGGGNIKMYGGSVIFLDNGATNTHFLRLDSSSGSSGLPFIFDGIRFEFRNARNKLCNITNLVQGDVFIKNSTILYSSASDCEDFVYLAAYSTLILENCSFVEQVAGRCEWTIGNSAANYAQNGRLRFINCSIPYWISDHITLDGAYGAVSAEGCRTPDVGNTAVVALIKYAIDFNYHWTPAAAGGIGNWEYTGALLKQGQSGNDAALRLKRYVMKNPIDAWPDTAEHTLYLPKNSILMNIHLRKPAGGADTTSTIFRVGRNDKSGTDHLVSNTAAMNVAHTGDATNLFYNVGDTENERRLRLYTDENPSGVNYGGYVIVEYY